MGFDVDGDVVYCHEFNHAGYISTVYMSTPHLPIRIEIENTGTAASATTLKKFCSAVVTEGGLPEAPGWAWAASRGVTALGVTTRRPLISIRLNPTFLTQVNRGYIIFKEMEMLSATNNCLWELVVDGALTGASWVDRDTNTSIAQYDISATAITGGRLADTGWVISGLGSAISRTQGGQVPIEINNSYDGTTPQILSLVGTSFTGTSNINALLRWLERR
jgi:hypothetical protein